MTIPELQQALDRVRETFRVPGYSVTVTVGGKPVTFTGGYSDIEQQQRPDGNTLFAIGSCTKSFVAGTICALADEGLLKLDDTVKAYIPEFSMYDRYVSENLTIRDMLCHRCGLPRHELSWYGRLSTLTEAEIIRGLAYLRPNVPFRYKWQYSNQMFALAGFLITRVTGLTWQDAVRKYIFTPLGITRCAFSPAEAKALGNCAEPYLYDKEKAAHYRVPHADIGAMGAAGSLYLSTEELNKWDRMLLGKGVFEGKRVLSEAMVHEMLSAQMLRGRESEAPCLTPLVKSHAYGLGLMTETFRGHELVHHGGHIDGFMADQSILPEDGFAISILTNVGMIRGAQVMRYVAVETLLGGGEDLCAGMHDFYENAAAKQAESNEKLWAERPANAPCPIPAEKIAGTYRDEGYGTMTIRPAEGSDLAIEYGDVTLTAKHYAHEYYYIEIPALMPGVLFPAKVSYDIRSEVNGFYAWFDNEGTEPIRFRRV
ncbi:MAG: serine hydrolase [Clostridia bacterium]|nr:serine hydrolase [Clostridia bacterium]